MLPAALSDNPVLAMLLNSFFAVIAVFLTYIFVTRYYGRFAGAVAGLLYAAAPVPLIYSRFIWQPNMMQPFVVLFFLALFRGVVVLEQLADRQVLDGAILCGGCLAVLCYSRSRHGSGSLAELVEEIPASCAWHPGVRGRTGI